MKLCRFPCTHRCSCWILEFTTTPACEGRGFIKVFHQGDFHNPESYLSNVGFHPTGLSVEASQQLSKPPEESHHSAPGIRKGGVLCILLHFYNFHCILRILCTFLTFFFAFCTFSAFLILLQFHLFFQIAHLFSFGQNAAKNMCCIDC